MSYSQFGTNANARRKRVKYEGTNTIYEGMALCYNYDATANILGYDKENSEKGATTAEGYQNEGKFMLVEEPSTANAFAFAGVVAGGSYAGLTGPRWIDIYVPNGAIVPVYTDKSITIKDKLYLEDGENTAINDSADLPCIGVAVETVDRSSTAGIVLVKLNPVVALGQIQVTGATASTSDAPALATGDIMIPVDIAGTTYYIVALQDDGQP